MAVEAFDIAEEFQTPVFVMSDLEKRLDALEKFIRERKSN